MDFKALEANYKPIDLKTFKKKTGRGGPATAFISEAGALIGGGLGTFLGPAGTVAGAGLGGGLGRLLENKVRDDRLGLADALKEGAMSAAFAAIPGGKAVGKTTQFADDAAGIAAKTVRGGGKLARLGNAMRSYPRGIVPGMSQPGGRILGTVEADAQNFALDKLAKGAKGLSKSSQGTLAEKEILRLTSAYKKTPEALSKMTKNDVGQIIKNINKNILNNPNLRGMTNKEAARVKKNLLTDIEKFAGKTKGDFVSEFVPKVNQGAKSIVAKGNVGSAQVQIWDEVRDGIKTFIDTNKGFSDKSGINKQLTTLLGARSNLSKTITRDIGASSGAGLTLGRTLENVAGPGLEIGGRAAQKLGRVTNSTIARQSTRQLGGRSLLGGMGSSQQPEIPVEEQALYNNMATTDMAQEQPKQSAYTLEQAIADIQKYPKDAAKIQAYYKFVQDAEGGGTVSAAERKMQRQAESAIQGLQQLKQLYTQAGGGQNRLPGIAGNIQGKLGGNSKTEAYNRIRDSLTTSLARAFGETGVLTDQDREVYRQALPRIEDTPEEAAIKLQYLEDMLAGSQPSQSPSESDIYNALQGVY